MQGGCAVNNEDKIAVYEELPEGTVPILKDTDFKNGFGVMGGENDPVDPDNTYQTFANLINPDNPDASFDWRIAQWGSNHSFSSELETVDDEDYTEYKNIAKSVKVYKGGGLKLTAYTSEEYSAPRKWNENWVHLLIEQVLSADDKVKFSEMKHLYMQLDFEIEHCDMKMEKSEYDSSVHAAQCVWYITVENTASKEVTREGRPDYMWFGVPVFDNRGMHVEDEGTQDVGYDSTGKYIFGLGRKGIFSDNAKVGVRYSYVIDVLPKIKKAFADAQSKNYLKGADFNDMAIGSTNFGFEIPGTFDVSVKVNKINILYD